MTKTYTLPNGKKAVFEYDINGVGKITLECMDELMGMIAEAPHIDIVRCKECKYYIDNMPEDSTDDECRWRSEEQPNPDDFCSYGERKE